MSYLPHTATIILIHTHQSWLYILRLRSAGVNTLGIFTNTKRINNFEKKKTKKAKQEKINLEKKLQPKIFRY